MSELESIDLSKLSSATVAERGEIYLLEHLSRLSVSLQRSDPNEIRTKQAAIQASLLNLVLNSSLSAPRPGRPIRSLISRCLILLLQKGETRPLFDVVQQLLRAFAAPKPADKENKIAIMYIVGEIMQALGDQVMSVVADIVAIVLRTIKQSNQPVIIRHACLVCLRKTVTISAKAISDVTLKELTKSLRHVLSDRAAPLQRAGAQALQALYQSGILPLVVNDIENILAAAIKIFDSCDLLTRNAIANLVAGLLVAAQLEGSAPAVEVRRKAPAKKDGADDDADDPYPSQPAASAQAGPQKLLSLPEVCNMLAYLFNKPSVSRRSRLGIVAVYAAIFTLLGTDQVEQQYGTIIKHLVQDLAGGVRATTNRTDALLARKILDILLRQIIGVRLLTEQGQMMAIQEIATLYLSRWPSMLPGSTGPSKMSLLVTLKEVAGLLVQLGSAPSLVEDVLGPTLLRLPEHPSQSVQIAAAYCLRCFCAASPTKLAPFISVLLELLNKDLSQLGQNSTASDLASRIRGRTLALAAITSLIPSKPLYASHDISSRVMSLAIQLLKQSGNHDLHVSSVEIHTAWTLVSALLTLGPSFTRIHLPQLLILWKNALPKTTSKDASAAQLRSEVQWTFLLHVREVASASILSFLQFNPSLLTADTARRVSILLVNGLSFATSFAATYKAPSDAGPQVAVGVSDRALMFQRRLFECFLALGSQHIPDSAHATLIPQLMSAISDPDLYTGSAAQAAIAASSGAFTSVWDAADQSGFGVTSLLISDSSLIGRESLILHEAEASRDLVECLIDDLAKRPTLEAIEFDFWRLFGTVVVEAPPVMTGVADAAVQLLAETFAAQNFQVQIGVLKQVVSTLGSARLDRFPGRHMAITVNLLTSMLAALRLAMRPARKTGDSFTLPDVYNPVKDLIRHGQFSQDEKLRLLASETLGRLCAVAGTAFMSTQVQFCISSVVENTEPASRAGCATTLGQIYQHVGALSAGPMLKTAVDILMSLAADPHPIVHFAALQAIGVVIDAASLSYSPFVNATLGTICRLYNSEAHEPEGGSPASVNSRGIYAALRPFCSNVDGIVRVLGPELNEQVRLQDICLVLLREFRAEDDEVTMLLAVGGLQHLLMFSPDAVSMPELVADLRVRLSSPRQSIKTAAINSVYQLVQRNAVLVSQTGGDRLIEDLFSLLDSDPSVEGVRDIISSWLRQSATINPSGWIDLCQRIMSRTSASRQAAAQHQNLSTFTDEESQGLGSQDEANAASRAVSRWRTQLFALQCVGQIFSLLVTDGRREHFDALLARQSQSPPRNLLINRISDIIKMAFTASASTAMPIRLEGLSILQDIIRSFARTQDLETPGSLMLEQYQAPIAAALTPAFASDSLPEVLALAIQVCATFVGSGIVKESNKMGRILRLLTSALESSQDANMEKLGDCSNLTSTAGSLLKIAVFSAWAELQAQSQRRPYLQELVRPYLGRLCPAWLATLREYARLRAESDDAINLAQSSLFDGGLGNISRDVALPFYEKGCLPMLQSVASLITNNNETMLTAFGIVPETASEAAPYFNVLVGLCFDVLAAPTIRHAKLSFQLHYTVASLELMENLLRPSLAGPVLADATLCSDILSLCYRLALTEPVAVQIRILRIVGRLGQSMSAETVSAQNGQANGVGDHSSKERPGNELQGCLSLAFAILQKNAAFPDGLTGPALVTTANVVEASFQTIVDLSRQHTGAERDALQAATLTVLNRILSTQFPSSASIEAILPSTAKLCQNIFSTDASRLLTQAIESVLAGCLQRSQNARRAADLVFLIKLKASSDSPATDIYTYRSNMLTAATIVGSSIGVKFTKPSIDQLCQLVLAGLSSSSEEHRSTTIASSAILFGTARSSSASAYCTRELLAILLHSTLQPGPTVGANEAKALVKLAGSVATASDQHTTTYAIAIPILAGITSATPANEDCRAEALSELLKLAQEDAAAFKATASGLPPQQRGELEGALRKNADSVAALDASTAVGPSINLKFSFAG